MSTIPGLYNPTRIADYGELPSNQPFDFSIVSNDGDEIGVHKLALSRFSERFLMHTLDPCSRACREGRLVFLGLKKSTLEGLKAYMYHEPYEWWSLDSEDKAIYFTQLWNLAGTWEVRGLKEHVHVDFLRWTSPNNVDSPDDLEYIRQAIHAVCKIVMPTKLWVAVVEKWAAFLVDKQSNGREGLYSVMRSYPQFGEAVREVVSGKR